MAHTVKHKSTGVNCTVRLVWARVRIVARVRSTRPDTGVRARMDGWDKIVRNRVSERQPGGRGGVFVFYL
jgi:hypothetical protein